MAFKARYDDGDNCPNCHGPISKGDLVQHTDSDRKILEHSDCGGDETRVEESVIRWENVTEESLDRLERAALEDLQVAPVGPQGVCPGCFLELPKSRLCGTC